MAQTPLPLVKRTKQEILDEYEKLQEQLDELRSTAKTVHSQPAVELVERVRAKTPQTIDAAFADFQTALHVRASELRASLLEQATLLNDLQNAIALSRQQLELQHHVSLVAETLDELVAEHEKRTVEFEAQLEQRRRDFEEQSAAKKKLWEREMEEYEYKKKAQVRTRSSRDGGARKIPRYS